MKKLLFILLIAVAFCSCEENRVPSQINIKKITLTTWPATQPNGISWESDGTGPDFFVSLAHGSTAMGNSSTVNNVSSVNLPSWVYEKTMTPPEIYEMQFFEEDLPFSAPFISFYINYKVGDDYPNPIRMSANGFTFEMQVEYKF